MSKFSQWLEAEWGRGNALLRHLDAKGKRVHKNQLSRWKAGKHPIPSALFEDILDFASKELKWTDLLPTETRS